MAIQEERFVKWTPRTSVGIETVEARLTEFKRSVLLMTSGTVIIHAEERDSFCQFLDDMRQLVQETELWEEK